MEKTCSKGHQFYKTSDCPVCPFCEKEKDDFFIPKFSAPARRALENAGIDSLEKLATYSEKELLKLHGIGKSAIPVLRGIMKSNKLILKLDL